MTKRIEYLLILVFLLAGLFIPARSALAAQGQVEPLITKGISPAGMLNADGTLRLNGLSSGTLDLSGYNVIIDPQRGPVFGAPQPGDSPTGPTGAMGAWAGIGNGGGVFNDRVVGIAVSGTTVYVVGSFTDAANLPAADYVAKWDGSHWSALGGNASGNGAIDFYVDAVAVSGSNVFVGGDFTHVWNGATDLETAAHLARWDGAAWHALGSNGAGGGSLNGDVTNIVINGASMYVAGRFTDVNNNGVVLTAADYVAKWNGSAWSALGSNGAGDGSFAANSGIYALAVSGSNLYVGGYFSNVNDNGTPLPAADYIVKWNGSHWSALGSNGAGDGAFGNGNYVNALAVSGTSLYAGGHFYDISDNGVALPAADNIAKWDGSHWSALGSNGAGEGSINNDVDGLVVNGADLYISGTFTNVNDQGTVLGSADYVAKWDGSHWSTLGSNGAGDGAIPPKSDPYIPALAMQGANLLVGGIFYDVNNNGVVLPQADMLAGWNGSAWSSLGSDTNGALSNGYTGSYVKAIAFIGSDLYVGGNFINVSNHGINIPEADYVAKWDGSNWSALGSDGRGDGALHYHVYALAVMGTNLYVGGEFSNVTNNGTVLTAADYVAKWDGSNWTALGSNGAGDGALQGSGGTVFALAVNGTDLYVGGAFTNVNDNGTPLPAADYVAKWDGSHWSALGSNGAGNGSLNAQVGTLTVSGNNLYAGGNFTDVNDGGTPLPAADYIAKWDGSHWSALGSNGAGNGSLNDIVTAITVNGKDIYAGGFFNDVNNNGTVLPNADYIAKWNGAAWSALGITSALNGGVMSIVVSGTDVYVSGWFTNVINNGAALPAADYVAKWNGTNWSALGSNGAGNGSLTDLVYRMAIHGTDLLVGGEFTNVNNSGTIVKEADLLAAYGIGIDTLAPNVVSITLANSNPTQATSVTFNVIFSEPVKGVDAADFKLTTYGLSGAALGAVSGSGAFYTVTANTGSKAGTLRLDLIDNDTVKDMANNPLGGAGLGNGSYTSGPFYLVRPHLVFVPKLIH